ncbi:MAG: Response regulator receiver sensor signal transduction histidine kinase [Verrucomicrobiales bacterium]|nr:Response regulator receiver sensor signal transduction histidine kinase [Verrucomicrobiales bacterium]
MANTDSPTTPAKVKPNLLVVDDEDGPRQSLRVVFMNDYNVLLANDGMRALELAKENKINVAVVDLRMQHMDGIEVMEKLKAVQPTIEIIMLTAYETIDTIRQALRLGACDYLNKPFDIAAMRKAIAKANDRHNVTEQIRASNDKLSQLQSELHNQRLQEEVMKVRGEIYGSILHDINGPLTIISGYIQLINQRVGDAQHLEGEDLQLIKERLNKITQQVGSSIEISQRYLSFIRQEVSPASRVSINQVLKDLTELLDLHPSKGDHALKVQIPSEEVQLQMNGTDLIQILLNLAINAFQASPKPHTVEVVGVICDRTVDLSTVTDGPHDRVLKEDFNPTARLMALTVRDNGPGIPADVITKVFQPYFTTKPLGQGTGLGLSIVQRLLKEAKGALHLHTKVGEGTSFTLYLPAA